MIFDVPKVTEALKESLSPDRTSVIYNTDNDVFEYYDGARWVVIGADVSPYTNEATGFPIGNDGEVDRSSSSISFDEGSRVFTISGTSGSYDILIKDKVHSKTGAQTTTISDTEGLHYIYFDETGSLTSATTFTKDIILKYVYVASIYWDAENNKVIHFGDERHGCVMDGATHLRVHLKDGAIFISGMALGTFSVDGSGESAAHAQFDIGSGAIRDEDIPHSLSAVGSTTAVPVLYKLSTNWRKATTANFKVYPDPTTGRLYYNNAGALTAVDNNKFVLYHIVATNDVLNPFYSIMGTTQYDTKSEARVGAVEEIKSFSGLPFVEFVFVGTVIFQTNDAYTNSVKAKIVSTDTGANYVDWRFSSSGLNPTTVNLTSHNNLGGIQGGSGGDYYHSDQPINTTDSPTFANITTTSNVTAQGDTVVSGSLTVGGITFPIADGSAGQVIKTDGAGNLSFVNSAGTGTVLDTYITSKTYTLNNSSTVTINTIFSSTDTGIYHFWTSGDPRIKGTVSAKSGDLGNSTLETVSSAVTGLQNNASTLNVYVSGSDIVFQNNTGSQVILVVRRETTPSSEGSSISDHNVLSNIQGGGSGNYYHSNQEINTTSSVTFGSLTLNGDIIVSGTAIDVDLIDNNASALSFDSPGKSGILEIVTTDGSEKVKMSGDLEISGNFTVNGTTTNVNTTNLVVEDKNIILGDVSSPSDTTADGGGITLKGLSDKTLTWADSSDSWTSSENIDLASGKTYKINNTTVLSSSQVLGKSLPSGDIVGNSDSQVLSNKSISLSSNTLTGTTAEFNTALSDNDFATVSGAEVLTNKTLTLPVISSISNSGTITFPTGTDTLVGRATNDTLSNKTLSLSDNTLSGTTAQFNAALTDNDFSTVSGSEVLTNKTISGSNNTLSNIGNASLTNSSITLNGNSVSLGGSLTAAQLVGKTIPTGDLVGTSDSQVLTGKTLDLSSNTLSGTIAQFNSALSDGDFSTISGSETLKNKSISLSDNTLTGTISQFNTALSDGDFATLAGSETLTSKTLQGVTLTGDITSTGTAIDFDLIDNNASALSFDSTGKNGILEIDTTDSAEKVKMSGGLVVSGTSELKSITASGTISLNSLTFPTSDGTSGQAVTTNGSGVLSFTTINSGGGGLTTVDLSNSNSTIDFSNYQTTGLRIQNPAQMTFTGGTQGTWYTVVVESDGTYSFTSEVRFPSDNAQPSVSANGKVDLYSLYCINSNKYLVTFAFQYNTVF